MGRSAIVSLLIVLLTPIMIPGAGADVPRTLSYQGVLKDENGNLVPDGDYVITFRLYVTPWHPTPRWEEIQTLAVSDGVFNALLGSGVPLDLAFNAPYWLGITIGDEPELEPRIELASSPYAHRAAVADSAVTAGAATDGDWTIAGDDMYSAVPGLVGIGTDTPLAHLHVERTDRLLSEEALTNEDLIVEDADAVLGLYSDQGGSYGSAITLGELEEGALTSKWSIHRTTGLNSQLRFALGPDPSYASNLISLAIGSGNIGLGTTDLAQHARINIAMRAGTPMIPSYERGILIKDHLFNGANRFEIQNYTGDTEFVVLANGNVGIGTAGATEELTVRGNLLLLSTSTGDPIVELGEGLDYAEGFDVTAVDEAEPGTVLVIDPKTPGNLTISRKPYDRRVAGIVAGGQGLGSGVRLGTDQFDCDVALAGRVYCNVDTQDAAIEPGDLLTTSATPGYAMKVTDQTRAQGAILGKAMEPLERGQTGQILVLVTLQ